MNTATEYTPVPLSDYWLMLKDHNWNYYYRDEGSAEWVRGEEEDRRLRAIASGSQEHDDLYEAMFTWSCCDVPLPPQPVAGPTLAQSATATIGLYALTMGSFLAWGMQ